MDSLETAFSIDTSSIKHGPGVTREMGYEMDRLGARRVMVVTDPNLTSSEAVTVTLESLRDEGIDVALFDQVSIEPTDASFKEAIRAASDGHFDGYVAVGGGSSMDTAKAANLYATYPADFLAYVNAPIGEGRHGLESFTALPYNRRAAPESPGLRPAYQGSNPISDVWAIRAIEMVSQNIVRAVHDPTDDEARGQMLLAATFAGVGFGNAGCHLPHGMSYPVSGMVGDFVPERYPQDHSLIPHGMSVILNAPAVFRFTAPTNPDRHLLAARLMGADVSGASPEDAGDLLADAIVRLVREIDIPNGLSAVGYAPEHVDALIAATLPQHRVVKLCPRPVNEGDLRQLFLDSMTLW